MSTSSTKLTIKSALNLTAEDRTTHNPDDPEASQDLNQLACCLKNAIFSKYVSDYLTEKAEEMWNTYERRIDKYLQDKHLDINCKSIRPQTCVELEQLARHQQENIAVCKRNIERLCSSRRRTRNDDDKYTVPSQTKQSTVGNSRSTRVPRTPRCIDNYQVKDDVDETQPDDFE